MPWIMFDDELVEKLRSDKETEAQLRYRLSHASGSETWMGKNKRKYVRVLTAIEIMNSRGCVSDRQMRMAMQVIKWNEVASGIRNGNEINDKTQGISIYCHEDIMLDARDKFVKAIGIVKGLGEFRQIDIYETFNKVVLMDIPLGNEKWEKIRNNYKIAIRYAIDMIEIGMGDMSEVRRRNLVIEGKEYEVKFVIDRFRNNMFVARAIGINDNLWLEATQEVSSESSAIARIMIKAEMEIRRIKE